MDSVYARFLQSASNYGENAFLHIPRQASQAYSTKAIDFTYIEMQAAVENIQSMYRRAGYGYGHRIALVLENRAEFFQHFFALNGLGVCIVPISAEFVVDEIAYLIDNSEVSLIVSLPEHIAKISQALGAINKKVEVRDNESLSDISTAPEIDSARIRRGGIADAAILYTSGTTGKPKGCVLPNEFFSVLETGM